MAVMGKVTNKRLIDANALNERFDKRIKWLRLDTHDQYSLGLYHGAVTDKDLIGEIPTVDAVEVVRCRDCKKHCEYKGNHYCKFWRMYYQDGSDFFCKAGERKEGAD